MKKTILAILAALILFSLRVNAQKKDSTQKDTVIVLSIQQANQLIQDIQIQMSGRADVKSEEWVADLKLIFGSAHISDKPKTTK